MGTGLVGFVDDLFVGFKARPVKKKTPRTVENLGAFNLALIRNYC
jgi:hypothetical protein